MIDLKELELDELEKIILDLGEKKFRSKQIFQWISKGVSSIDEMPNIPKELKNKLKGISKIGNLKILKVQESKDGTKKYLFELEDGNAIESVFMKYKFGNSICISSQAGCRMGCKFCASTIGGLKRNLSASEMLDQIICSERDTGEKINHIVIMGTGEPFDNIENLFKFLKLVHSTEGLNIGYRNITVSTCGILPGIEALSQKFPQVNLAISLHAVDNNEREKIMPITKKYKVKDIIDAAKKYVSKTGRRITFEYTLVEGVNDGKNDILLLANELKGINCHINLIPLNKVEENGFVGSNKKRAYEIAEVLKNKGIQVTVRREMGSDISAACGQLRLAKK